MAEKDSNQGTFCFESCKLLHNPRAPFYYLFFIPKTFDLMFFVKNWPRSQYDSFIGKSLFQLIRYGNTEPERLSQGFANYMFVHRCGSKCDTQHFVVFVTKKHSKGAY